MKPILTVLLLLACGCGPVLNTRRAQLVKLAGTESSVADCDFVGNLLAEEGSNFSSFEDNTQHAEMRLRDQAAQRGATHLLASPPVPVSDGPLGRGCQNCLKMSGRAFKCKLTGQAAQERQAAEAVMRDDEQRQGDAAASARCAKQADCQKVGKCTAVGNRCSVGSDDDCANSKACTAFNRCHASGGECVK